MSKIIRLAISTLSLALALGFCSSALAADLELKVFKGNKYEPVKVKEHQGFHLSQECFKGKGKDPAPKCQAFDETTHKVATSKSVVPLAGNPAAHSCLDHGGLNRILLSSDNKQYDYCLFKDGSMVDAWDLYNHFNPKKVIE